MRVKLEVLKEMLIQTAEVGSDDDLDTYPAVCPELAVVALPPDAATQRLNDCGRYPEPEF